MQAYRKGSLGPLITFHYNGYLETTMQGYGKVNVGPFMTVDLMAK
jgi:hypothetical protein